MEVPFRFRLRIHIKMHRVYASAKTAVILDIAVEIAYSGQRLIDTLYRQIPRQQRFVLSIVADGRSMSGQRISNCTTPTSQAHNLVPVLVKINNPWRDFLRLSEDRLLRSESSRALTDSEIYGPFNKIPAPLVENF